MLGFFAAIACRRAPSRALSAETFPSSESFPSCYCSFAIARKTIATAYCPLHNFPASFSSRFSSLGLHTMHQVAIAAHAEPSLRGVQNFASVGYHWQKKHTFTTACPAFVRKPLHSCSSSIEAVFPFPRSQAVSIHACALREDRFPSDNGLPSVPEEPKQLFPSSNCEAETERVTEMAMATVTEKTDEARVEEKTSHMEAELFLPHEDIEANACCAEGEEDMVASVSPLSLEEIDAESAGGRSPRKTSSDAIASRARNRSERRRKGGLFAQNIQNDAPDLLTVPGIGPRNFQKLVAKGIGKVAELKQLYRDNFLNDESKKMVEYLQSSVGIVHKNHAESITSYVKHHVDEELKVQSDLDKESCVRQKKKVTICVEGNISVGKTTFLQKVANEIIELRDLVEIVPEPVDKWKDVGPDHFNLLDAFYNEPERYAYTFQNYVFATRLMKEQETSKGMKPLRLMERSIFSDRLVFVRAVHEAKWMSELELRIYESWFDPFISALPGLVPDGFIYLRASPDTCLQRLHMRNRPEERSVTLEYLRGLHEKHEQCFFPSECSEGIYSVSSWLSGSHRVPPPPRIRDRVFYLEGDHLHSSIRKVPALILDCEASIDFNRDLEARAEYAQQVAEFYEYIRSNKDLNMNETDPSGAVNPFLLPRTGGLLRPDGGSPLLHGHSLDAFNFARHSSAFMR